MKTPVGTGLASHSFNGPRQPARTSRRGKTHLTKALAMLASVVPWLPNPALGDGELDVTFDPAADNAAISLASQPDGKLLMAGLFNSVLGEPRAKIARLDADDSLDSGFAPTANNFVNCSAVLQDGRIVLGGRFTQINGTARGRIACLQSDGSLDPDFDPQADNEVYSLAVQGDGRILIGGAFLNVAGTSHRGLARLNPDGSLDDSLAVTTNSWVSCILPLADGRILIAGDFTTIGGIARNYVARLLADGSVDPMFDPSPNRAVHSMVVQADGKLVIGGYFWLVKGTDRNNLARINTDGSLDTAFDPNPNRTVNTVALQTDGKILVGGRFTQLGTTPCSYLARLGSDGTKDSGFTGNVDGFMNRITLEANGGILIQGDFSHVGETDRNGLARLQNGATTDSLTVPDTTRIEWLRSGGGPQTDLVAFEVSEDGSLWTPLGMGSRIAGGWELNGLSLPLNGIVRARARIDASGVGLASSGLIEKQTTYQFGSPEIDVQHPAGSHLANRSVTIPFGNVLVMAGAKSKTFIVENTGTATLSGIGVTLASHDAGDYTASQPEAVSLPPGARTSFTVTLTPRGTGGRQATLLITSNDADENPFLIILTGTGVLNGAASSDFTPMITNGSCVFNIARQANGKLVAAGEFFGINNVARNRIARLEADGTLDPAFNPNADGTVFNVAIQENGSILVAGRFDEVGGLTRHRLARIHSDGAVDAGYSPNINNQIFGLTSQSDGKWIIGGSFSTVEGNTRNGIARLNTDGSHDTSFNASAEYGVQCTAIQDDGKILLGGNFTKANGYTIHRLARLNSSGALDSLFQPNPNSTVQALAVQPDGKILIGGGFTMVSGVSRSYLARLKSDGSFDTTFQAYPDNIVNCLALQTDGRTLIGGSFTTVNGTTRNHLARLGPNGELDTSFDPNANGSVFGIVVEPDGNIVVGGTFSSVSGETHYGFARLLNAPAVQSIQSSDSGTLEWFRSGTSPEAVRVQFQLTTDGSNWIQLGQALRIGGGWRLSGLNLPALGTIQASAITVSGSFGGATSMNQSQLALNRIDEARNQYVQAATAAGLTGEDAAQQAIPFHDGISNLLKYAFNLNMAGPDVHMMPPNGTMGLPCSQLLEIGGTIQWKLQYLRRRGAGLIYTPMVSSGSGLSSFIVLNTASTVETIDNQWERITVLIPKTNPNAFFRIAVTLP